MQRTRMGWVGALVAPAVVLGMVVAGAGPAAADPPTITGTLAVGGTLTVSHDQNTSCDGEDASVAVRRVTGPNTSVTIIIGTTPLVLGQPWTIDVTIPATDLGGTALQQGDQILISAGGICNANGDQGTFVLDDVIMTLGAPVQATTTTSTPAPPPAETTTTAPAAAAVTTTAAAAAAQELPRTGGGNGTVGAVGAALLAGGAVVLAAGRRRASA